MWISKHGDGNSNALRKFTYASPSSSKRRKGSIDYLLSVITLAPIPVKEKKWMLWLVTRFVDDRPLTPLLINLCGDCEQKENII